MEHAGKMIDLAVGDVKIVVGTLFKEQTRPAIHCRTQTAMNN